MPDSGRAILGFVHFTGPIGMKNKIKINASRIEKMADPVATQTVTTSYADLEDFQVSGYTLNEVVAEKIRSTMQRSKVRDYYDIWKMFGKDSSHGFDTELIGGMVKQKCTINNIEYNPSKIFDSGRLSGRYLLYFVVRYGCLDPNNLIKRVPILYYYQDFFLPRPAYRQIRNNLQICIFHCFFSVGF